MKKNKNLNQSISFVLIILPFLAVILINANISFADTNVSIQDDYFSLQSITIPVNSTVTWMNFGTHQHSVVADNGSFNSGVLNPGASFSHYFSTPGFYNYYCQFHGGLGGVGMFGTITVTASNIVNGVPIANGNTVTVTENTPTSITLLAQDTNSPVRPLTYSIVNYPTYGTITNLNQSNSSLTYAPNGNFVGTDSFTFLVNNGISNSNTVTEIISVVGFGTSVTSTTDFNTLQNDLLLLAQQVKLLQQQLNNLVAQSGSGNYYSNTGFNYSSSGIGPNYAYGATTRPRYSTTFRANGVIELVGSGFGANEPVQVVWNNQVLLTAHADANGSVNTGSFRVPNSTGSQTFTLTGVNSGRSTTVTVTIN